MAEGRKGVHEAPDCVALTVEKLASIGDKHPEAYFTACSALVSSTIVEAQCGYSALRVADTDSSDAGSR